MDEEELHEGQLEGEELPLTVDINGRESLAHCTNTPEDIGREGQMTITWMSLDTEIWLCI